MFMFVLEVTRKSHFGLRGMNPSILIWLKIFSAVIGT